MNKKLDLLQALVLMAVSGLDEQLPKNFRDEMFGLSNFDNASDEDEEESEDE